MTGTTSQACNYTAGYWPLMPTTGATLKKLRSDAKMSIEDLAHDAKVSRATVYRIESGTTEPDLPTLRNLTKALDLSLTAFFAHVEGTPDLQAQPLGDRTPASVATPHGADSSVSRPLDDTGALLAGISSAVIALARSVDRLGDRIEERAARKQAAAAGAHEPRRTTRHRKTG